MQKRSSIHPSVSRPSVAGPPISSILPAKALELHGLEQVKGATSQLLERVEGLAEEAHTLAEGGEAVGKVLGVWEELFSVIRLMGCERDLSTRMLILTRAYSYYEPTIRTESRERCR